MQHTIGYHQALSFVEVVGVSLHKITSLANYYVISTGRDLILTLIDALDEAAAAYEKPAAIVQC